MIDIAGANIDTSWTHQIQQLVYTDGIKMGDMLNDLALIEPDMIWEVGLPALAGKHTFTLRKWPTVIRYEATTIDGWSAAER